MEYKHIQRTYLIGWLIASIVWYLIRISTLETGHLISNQLLVFFFTSWLSQGFLYGILLYFITRYITKRVKFYQMITIALVTQMVVAILIIAIIYPVSKSFNLDGFPNSFFLFMTSRTVVFGTLYSLIVNALIAVTMSASLILGQGMLKNIISGKYYTPQQETRIFMFLDLHDSTTIAEQLGHLAFSKLIQDCFYELSIFNSHNGDIYKYVGDEAIITWPNDSKTNPIQCIQSFYAFAEKLEQKSAYFKSKYNVLPLFKAGIHIGSVTVTEIGKTKREIAYLGDTVNTTARIQGECNRQKSSLLISEDLKNILPLKSDYKLIDKGSFILRGKNKAINIFAVNLVSHN